MACCGATGRSKPYLAAEWQTDEILLSRVAVATDATALPQAYRLTLGMSPLQANGRPGDGDVAGCAHRPSCRCVDGHADAGLGSGGGAAA